MIAMDDILKIVADTLNVPEEAILLSNKVKGARTQNYVHPRQLCMTFARMYNCGSLAEIGKYFGGRDHATVLSAIKAVSDDVDTNKWKRDGYDRVRAKLETLKEEVRNLQETEASDIYFDYSYYIP